MARVHFLVALVGAAMLCSLDEAQETRVDQTKQQSNALDKNRDGRVDSEDFPGFFLRAEDGKRNGMEEFMYGTDEPAEFEMISTMGYTVDYEDYEYGVWKDDVRNAITDGPDPALVPSLVLPSSTGTSYNAFLKRTPTNESATLLQLINNSLKVSSAIKQSWTGEVCKGNVSTWVGVACTLGRVSGLRLTYNVQGGSLPPQLYLFPNLIRFNCRSCSISGTLPSEWGSHQHLMALDLDNNRLTGTLPSTWGGMASVQTLSLRENHFTGTLPKEWSVLKLNWLGLKNNSLTGTLPSEWSSITDLKSLYLSNNMLTGMPCLYGHHRTS